MSLVIEYLPVDSLKPYDKNARKHSDKDVQAIVNSIQEFGFNDPIGVWGDENLIVEGHGRLQAAQSLGMKAVPCIHLDHMSDEQRRAYALAHNKTNELSAWDWDILGAELDSIVDTDMQKFGFDDVGFDEAALDDLFYDDAEKKEKKPNRIQCPYCGEWFETK